MSLSTCQTSGVEPTQLESYMYWEKKKKEEKKKELGGRRLADAFTRKIRSDFERSRNFLKPLSLCIGISHLEKTRGRFACMRLG